MRRNSRTFKSVIILGMIAVTLAGCSSGEDQSSDSSDEMTQSSTGQEMPDSDRTEIPGVNGEIVLVKDSTAQVQDSDSQNAVSWTDQTTFKVEVDGTLADVVVGSCVVAISNDTTEESSSSNQAIEATSVSITEATDDGCESMGGGGMPGSNGGSDQERPSGDASGSPSDMPSNMPSDGSEMPEMPDGAQSGQMGMGGFGGMVSGEVTSVEGTTIVVSTNDEESSFIVTDETTYSLTVAGSADEVVVGQCMSATGENDSSGTLSAEEITISTPTDEGCTSFQGMTGGMGGPGTTGGKSTDSDTSDPAKDTASHLDNTQLESA